MQLMASARGAGAMTGQLLVLGLVGFGVWRLGLRIKISKPLRILAVVVVVGFAFVASNVGKARSADLSAHPCTAIGMTPAQEDRVKRVVAAKFPSRAIAATTSGGYAFCALMNANATMALAFHAPIPKPGKRAFLRVVLRMPDAATASHETALIKSHPHRFLTIMSRGAAVPPTEHVTAVRSVTTCVIVTISEIRVR
jgi:hypothetical protein